MSYVYRMLTPPGQTNSYIENEIRAALAVDDEWTRFIEVRMAAGPTVSIERRYGPEEHFYARVSWGSLVCEGYCGDLRGALETADRLAFTLYEVRREVAVVDH